MSGWMEIICEGGVRLYCWVSSVSSPFPGLVVPTHLLCKFNLECERLAEGSSGLLWVSQTAARCRHAGLWWGGLAALRVCLRKRFYVYSHKAQNALHTMDVTRRVNPGRSIMTAAKSMLDVTWGFESDLVLFAFDVLTQEWILEQVPGHRSFIWVRLKAGKDEGFGLWRKRLWDLRMDLKHAHLVRREQRRMEEMIFINSLSQIWKILYFTTEQNTAAVFYSEMLFIYIYILVVGRYRR